MSDALAAEHRRALGAVTTLTRRQLKILWQSVSGPNAEAVRDALMDTIPLLAETYGDMAGALAADYYDEVREQAGARGRFTAQPAPLPGTARYEALVRWGVDPLFSPTPDAPAALSRISGGLHRVVADVSRDTIVQSSTRDPAARGWRRITDGDACKFCRMLADRGAVYRESNVRFASHDDCGCSAAPAFTDGPPVSVEQYVASKRTVTDADRAAVRKYLRENY